MLDHHIVINSHEVRSLVGEGYDDWRKLVEASVVAFKRRFADRMFPFVVVVGDNVTMTVSDKEGLDKLVLAFNDCVSALEEIGAFNPGQHGDLACSTLQRIGVWSNNVRRV